MTGIRRVVPLTLGWEELPVAYSLYGTDPDARFRVPVPGVLLDTGDGWVLLDSGFNPTLLRDPLLRSRFHPLDGSIQAFLPDVDGHPLEAAIEEVGLALEDVKLVAMSHLHNDHAGGVGLFAGRDVPVHVQAAELAYALHDPDAEAHGIFRIDIEDPRLKWVQADGDVEVAPGIHAVLTAGHTPGHQSFVIDLADGGGLVLAFDAADLQANLDQEHPIGGFVGVDPEQTVEPIRRLKALAAQKGYRLIPGHDPHVWPALTRELAERHS
ncbi:MAG: N-acyl homoserine lactonase family protein [Frankiales bacterium]|nr:N-acyl homoserine lactonase family protein [Frankiales bacterium]